MTAPSYQLCQDAERPDKCNDGHNGLWFERFADFYESDFSIKKKKMIDGKEQNPGAAWLQKHFKKKVGESDQLTTHCQMQMQLVDSLDGVNLVFKAGWHFVTGMGNPHPVENGFAWHPTLGVPYLTGAAVKGLVRGYIENYLDTEDESNPDKKELLLRWFGSTDKDPTSAGYKAQAGELIFFDALPTEPVQLGVDVMTPHMGKWYAEGGSDNKAGKPEAVPADWHDPVPVSFLVAKDITLQFGFALRPHPGAEKAQKGMVLGDVAKVLESALEHEGAGAKTTTGYGGMRQSKTALASLKKEAAKAEAIRVQKEQEAAEAAAQEAALAEMSPIEREIAEFSTVIDAINALKNGQWEGDSQQQAAQYLKVRMQDEKVWKEQSAAKNPKKDKSYQRTRVVIGYL